MKTLPLKKVRKRSKKDGGNRMAINDEHPMTKTSLEREQQNNMHSCISKLKCNHSQIWLHFVQTFTPHFCSLSPSL